MSHDLPILIVGVGSIGERHLCCFQDGGGVSLSICEVDATLRNEVAQRYGIERTYETLAEALEHPHLAAVIATPAHLHVRMATDAAAAGLHVLIEKPLSVSTDGLEKLRETIGRKQLVAAVAYVIRAHPAMTAMRHAIQSGKIGRPLHIISTCGQHFPTYRPAYREIYYRDHATGGGAVQDALTHWINLGEWLAGPVDCLVADAAHQVLEGVDVEDTVNVIARHGRVMASYSFDQHQAPFEGSLTVVCEGGTTRFEYHRNRWRWMVEPGSEWHDETFDPFERNTMFKAQAAAFLDAIENQTPPLCSLEEGIRSLEVNTAILASVEQRSWVTLNPEETAE